MPLVTFDLKTVFACAVELAGAMGEEPSEHHTPESRAEPACREALDRIEIECKRLKLALGASGPLTAADFRRDKGPPTWEAFRSQFEDANHPAAVRRALWKLANAAVDLSGYACLAEEEPLMRKRGLRLLTQGVAQLWKEMTPNDREAARPLLAKSRAALGWPPKTARNPPPYKGPREIPEADQYRIIDMTGGFVARPKGCLNHRVVFPAPAGQVAPRVKGLPGRPGYPLEAWEYAQKLRQENPRLKAHSLRQRCLEEFSEDDLPPDAESFRRWLNRRRANRANRAK